MHRRVAHSTTEPTEEQIQHTAYLIWLQRGKPAGQEREHWFAAKELLRHHHGRPDPFRRGIRQAPLVAHSLSQNN